MDWDLMEWMMEWKRSHAVENATADNCLTSATPSNYDNVPNKVCSTGGKVGQGLVEEHQIVKSADGSQELKEEGEETTGKVGRGPVEEHQIVKVMTDEQEEALRRQISASRAIRESLLESYRRIASEYLSQHGTRIGNPSTDPLKSTEGCKRSNRKQRWSATPTQTLILDKIYHSGKVSPNKEEIKWITSELSQHGEITVSNVYNWFQNRKTREKRKRVDELVHKIKSEVEPGAESSNGKKIQLEKIDFDNKQYLSTDAHFFQTSQVNSEMHFINQESDIAHESIN
ncbi:WUSCHEL-related homeobox 8-like [Phoenix dactylifera]|uniref:WUSCHEL-related homeobox 8 n=1 Tax=Phoenix dactylifera TaxID=42345 RepID=A0A8B7CYF7_PHODC|nr:WUSCHEL-related homeobox 8 [Phoenix dactylifera]XP_038978072.1 WUSCHEL-related homeobox 8-like [Phoenix dactylifera]